MAHRITTLETTISSLKSSMLQLGKEQHPGSQEISPNKPGREILLSSSKLFILLSAGDFSNVIGRVCSGHQPGSRAGGGGEGLGTKG